MNPPSPLKKENKWIKKKSVFLVDCALFFYFFKEYYFFLNFALFLYKTWPFPQPHWDPTLPPGIIIWFYTTCRCIHICFSFSGQLVVLRKSVKVFLYIFFCQSQLLPNLAPGDYILNILDSTLPKDSSAQVLAFNECFRRFLTFFFLIHKLETGKQCLVVLKMILWLTKITTYKKDSGL